MARVGSLYRFVPTLFDRHVAEPNTIVRVIPASKLGVSGRLPACFAYIEHLGGHVLGRCGSGSLIPLNPRERAIVRRNMAARRATAKRCGRIPSSRMVIAGFGD